MFEQGGPGENQSPLFAGDWILFKQGTDHLPPEWRTASLSELFSVF